MEAKRKESPSVLHLGEESISQSDQVTGVGKSTDKDTPSQLVKGHFF